MDFEITILDIWERIIHAFYVENNKILFSCLMNSGKGKAYVKKAVFRYERPIILFRNFSSSDDDNEAGRKARYFMENRSDDFVRNKKDKSGYKDKNICEVTKRLNQDCFVGLEQDLNNLLLDSVGLSLHIERFAGMPDCLRLRQFIGSNEEEVRQCLAPKLESISARLTNCYEAVFTHVGFDPCNIDANNAVKCLTLLLVVAVSQLTPMGNPQHDLLFERKKLEKNIETYIKTIKFKPKFIASNAHINPCETYVPTAELKTLAEYFCNNMSEAKIGLIHGMSGCGKSTLARAFAAEVQGKYDAIIWTHYRAEDGFRGILDDIPMQDPSVSNEEKIAVLRSGTQKVLIIIDNFDETDCHEPLPRWGNTHILFTSRYLGNSFAAEKTKIIPLDCNKALSLAIFKSVFFHITDQEASSHQLLVADRILATVNYHTYATDLIAREIAENYSAEEEITCYEQYLHSIWAGVEVESRKDRFVGMAAKEATFDAHIELLFADILSRTKASPCDQSIMFLFSMHNRWKRETITMLLGDSKTKGRLKVSKSILQLLKKNILQEEVLTDRYYGITERILSIHPLFLRAVKNGSSWDTDREIQKVINNFCAQWNNPEGIHGTHSWLDRDQWPAEYSHRVDRWVQMTTSAYLSGNSTWDAQISLAICFMLQPFFSSSESVELSRKCLGKHTGHVIRSFFLCSSESVDGRFYFIHIPEQVQSVPLLLCGISYEPHPACSLECGISGAIALRNVVANQEKLVIPSRIEGCPVHSIWYVFAHERNYKYSVRYSNFFGFRDLQPEDVFKTEHSGISLKSVVIEDGIHEIHSNAFEGLEIEEIVLPNSLSFIGPQAFFENRKLCRIVMSKHITEIPEGCFSGCSSLESFTIPDSVVSIGRYAFAFCTRLSTVIVQGNLQAVGDGAFIECSSLDRFSITQSSSIIIGEEALGYCANLKDIRIVADEIHIARRAFVCCHKLENVSLLGNRTSISPGGFLYCPRLKKLEAPSIAGEDIDKILTLAATDTDEEITAMLQQFND